MLRHGEYVKEQDRRDRRERDACGLACDRDDINTRVPEMIGKGDNGVSRENAPAAASATPMRLLAANFARIRLTLLRGRFNYVQRSLS